MSYLAERWDVLNVLQDQVATKHKSSLSDCSGRVWIIFAANFLYFFYLHPHSELIFFCSFTTPQEFWQSSATGALSTLVLSVVVLYSLTRATLMSTGKEETRVCGYMYIYIYTYIYIYIYLYIYVNLALTFCHFIVGISRQPANE